MAALGVVAAGPQQLVCLEEDTLLGDAVLDAVRILAVDLTELLLLVFRNVRLAVLLAIPPRGHRNSRTGFGAHPDSGASWMNSFAAAATEWAQEAMDCVGGGGGMFEISRSNFCVFKEVKVRRLVSDFGCARDL